MCPYIWLVLYTSNLVSSSVNLLIYYGLHVYRQRNITANRSNMFIQLGERFAINLKSTHKREVILFRYHFG